MTATWGSDPADADDSHHRRSRHSRLDDPEDDENLLEHSRSPSREPVNPPSGRGGSRAGRTRVSATDLAVALRLATPPVAPSPPPSKSASDISSVGLLVVPPSSPRSPSADSALRPSPSGPDPPPPLV
nr:pectinesterase inhibitor 10-like [Aegilops tauschii subsp. strangulata]